MAAVLLALRSAAGYGLSDFLGGRLSRKGSAWPVAVAGQASAAACTSLVALTVAGHPRTGHFAWAIVAGLGAGADSRFLYRGLAAGPMAPASAVGAAIVPVLAGAALGERLSRFVVVGMATALSGIWLVSATAATRRLPSHDNSAAAPGRLRGRLPAGLIDGAAAGLGFGAMFATLGQIPRGAGLWPLAAYQATSVPVLIAVAATLRARWVPLDRASGPATLTGPLGTLSTGAFLLATQHGYLSIAGILVSLYPARTVLLATAVLKERIHLQQGIGLGRCAAAVTCIAAG